MGYFGSSLGGLPGVGFGGSTMFMPNAYGGYSTIAAGSPAGQEASYQLSSLRNMLSSGGYNKTQSGQAATRALFPFMQMQVSPLDAGQQMARTFGQAGINFGNLMSQSRQYIKDETDKAYKESRGMNRNPFGVATPQNGGSSETTSSGTTPQNPLSYLGGIFGQYGGGMGGGSFGSGWGR